MKTMLRSLLQYRQFIYSSIRHDLVHRFAASKLGGLWSIFNPLSQVLIYALILSNVLHSKLPNIESKYAYTIYLMAGLLGWNLFNDIFTRSIGLFVDNANLLKKVNFPRIVLPVILTSSCVINNILLFIVMEIIFLILGHTVSLQVLWLIPLTLSLVLLATGLGLVFGIMNVFVRDISQLIPIILQVWFWLTPIVYPISIIPAKYHYLVELNPIYFIIDGYHNVIVYNKPPVIAPMFTLMGAALLIVFFGLFLFRRAGPEMVDVL